MARVAFVMDRALRKIGLSGRSFVPLLVGFGCSVPAVMATRTLPSEHDRKMTVLLTPFMSCSAKLPVYALLSAAFFPQAAGLVTVALYAIGILVGIAVALVLKRTAFRGEPVPFIMELPNYRLPGLKTTLLLAWDKAKGFVTKAFTIILVASVVVWFLQTFDIRFNVVSDQSASLLAGLGGIIAPLFVPLGFGDWRAACALATGFMAKESVVSTLTVLTAGLAGGVTALFTPLSAFSFLVFTLLYTPCVAAIGAVRSELGGRFAAGMVALQCGVAWVVACLVFVVGTLAGLGHRRRLARGCSAIAGPARGDRLALGASLPSGRPPSEDLRARGLPAVVGVVLHEAPAADARDDEGDGRRHGKRCRELQDRHVAVGPRVERAEGEERGERAGQHREQLDEHLLGPVGGAPPGHDEVHDHGEDGQRHNERQRAKQSDEDVQ